VNTRICAGADLISLYTGPAPLRIVFQTPDRLIKQIPRSTMAPESFELIFTARLPRKRAILPKRCPFAPC